MWQVLSCMNKLTCRCDSLAVICQNPFGGVVLSIHVALWYLGLSLNLLVTHNLIWSLYACCNAALLFRNHKFVRNGILFTILLCAPSAAFLASSSTLPLPGMPLCPGTQPSMNFRCLCLSTQSSNFLCWTFMTYANSIPNCICSSRTCIYQWYLCPIVNSPSSLLGD